MFKLSELELVDSEGIKLTAEVFDNGILGLNLKNWNTTEEVYFEFNNEAIEELKQFISDNPL